MAREEPVHVALNCLRTLSRCPPVVCASNHVLAEGRDVEIEGVVDHVVVEDANRPGFDKDDPLVQALMWASKPLMKQRTTQPVAV